MDYRSDVSYFLSYEELQFVLAAMDFQNFYCLAGTGLTEFTSENVNRILADLYQKGFIEEQDQKVRFLSPLSDIAVALRDSRTCLELIVRDPAEYTGLFYKAADRILLMEREAENRNSLRLTLLPVEEWPQILSEKLPSYFTETDPEIFDAEADPGQDICIAEFSSVDNRTGEKSEILQLCENGFSRFLLTGSARVRFTADSLPAVLNDREGEQND